MLSFRNDETHTVSSEFVVYRIFSLALLFLVPILVSCGGGSSGGAPPVEISISAPTNSIFEDSQDAVTVTVSLSQSSSTNISVVLEITGTATPDVDYELSATSVRFPAGTTTVRLTVKPFRDWENEPRESINISIGNIQGNGTAAFNANEVQIFLQNGPTPSDYKLNVSANLVIFSSATILSSGIRYRFTVYNLGRAAASSTQASVVLRKVLRDTSSNVYSSTIDVPALSRWGSYSTTILIPLTSSTFEPNTSYYGFASLDPTPEEISAASRYGTSYFGFSLNNDLEVVSRCTNTEPEIPTEEPDKFLEHHWNLDNTGQNAFAQNGGVPGADLNMDRVLDEGPYGENVTVAVVDTGLELCHPDLAPNVDVNGSYNFAARGTFTKQWYGATELDPFNPENLGDHGTSVAGIIGAVANNGIGGRGVAPRSRLRGFNYLGTSADAEEALGFSDDKPRSSDVDIFNMSYGSLSHLGTSSSWTYNLYQRGITDLRGGRGALYVKSAGNSFFACESIEHSIRDEIGCSSSNGDPTNNLPFLVIVGALNASDTRAGYSSTGSNLWISAPAGEYGDRFPASISTDQQGKDRGYVVLANRGLANQDTLNPTGNYISTFNGTSAAAPNASGAIAVLLSVNPNLTWRDVKYILARTARKIDPNILPVSIAFGGGKPHVLQHAWIQNGAGYNFHNWFGFGAINLDDAVALARTLQPDSLGTFIKSDDFRNQSTIAIPDYHSDGVESRLTVTGFSESANIEAVVLKLEGSHVFMPDMGITLISPDGTQSIVNKVFNDFLVHHTTLSWSLLTNAFYGESPNGDWTLRVVDADPEDTGEITEWSLEFYYGTHPQ